MRIVLNGRPTDVPDEDLAALLRHHAGPGAGYAVAVAVNGEVVPRAAHAGHRLRPGDVVEVVEAVAGG